jgi:hypothetical protein
MCDSCGETDDLMTEVFRLYITPASWDTEASTREAEFSEKWCGVCLAHYPHRVA